MTDLHQHMSRFLGSPSSQDRLILDKAGRSIRLKRFENQPASGAVTVITDGLSALVNPKLHEELLISVWREELTSELLLVMEFVVRQLAAGLDPLVYGDVIGPAGPLVTGTALEALLVYEPVYFPPEFTEFDTDDGCRIRLQWLIPIFASEAQLVAGKGIGWFERLLQDQDPDLMSLARSAVVAP